MEPRSGPPSFWVTHLSKALVGEQPCMLQPWISGRFKLEDRGDPGSLVKWKADHSQLLQTVIAKHKAEGWKCKAETFFKVTGETAIVSGKCDLIAEQKDKRPRIVDAKSGMAKDSDVAQVLIEMVLIPMAWNKKMLFEGEVVYATGNTIVLEPHEADTIKPRLFTLIRNLATIPKPSPSPSRDACRFCNVPDSECGQRWVETNDTVSRTVEF